ncbi:SDR family oxidoreductase [Methylocaldum sp.]|uniref:SDR family oxidoreductase n=1 Tax=Methylocaldum sp. TaxID=1969727 RepID=UPI002D63CA24|nr:SDR family oxidoreductase [Methylocaldum sp.]HYE34451.1 SDR family oxidoreductase [Methylocaldum sp.]
MPSVLITGSNRGLGLEWSRQYAKASWRVFATCRHPEEADELRQLAETCRTVSLHRLDVTDADQISALANELEHEPIDVLLNNAGVYYEKYAPLEAPLDYQAWTHTFQVNTMAALRMAKTFIGNLALSEKRLVVAISSHMGSIAEIDHPGSYFYRSSKAALNAVMKGLSLELKPLNIGVLLLHPGWVRTRMGGPDAPLLPEESVRGMRKLIDEFTISNTARFFRYNGTEIPW